MLAAAHVCSVTRRIGGPRQGHPAEQERTPAGAWTPVRRSSRSFRLVSRWLRDRPIAGFLLLAFGLSYLVGFPTLIGYTAWAPPQPRVLRTYASRVLVVYGPGLAAILLSLLARGRTGAADLIRRLVPHPSDLRWGPWIVVAGALSSALALAFAGVSWGQLTGSIRSAGFLLLTHFILQVVVVSIGEELGWRGWLLPRLLERHNRLRATCLTAAAWGLWHGPLLLSSPRTTALFLFAVFGLSVFYTWLVAHCGQRLFPVVLAHATVNAPIFFWEEFSAAGSHASAAASAWTALEIMYGVAGCALVAATWAWWMQEPEVAAPSTSSEFSPSAG
jgi:membrane protease YdiL (CAAX protease family)